MSGSAARRDTRQHCGLPALRSSSADTGSTPSSGGVHSGAGFSTTRSTGSAIRRVVTRSGSIDTHSASDCARSFGTPVHSGPCHRGAGGIDTPRGIFTSRPCAGCTCCAGACHRRTFGRRARGCRGDAGDCSCRASCGDRSCRAICPVTCRATASRIHAAGGRGWGRSCGSSPRSWDRSATASAFQRSPGDAVQPGGPRPDDCAGCG